MSQSREERVEELRLTGPTFSHQILQARQEGSRLLFGLPRIQTSYVIPGSLERLSRIIIDVPTSMLMKHSKDNPLEFHVLTYTSPDYVTGPQLKNKVELIKDSVFFRIKGVATWVNGGY